MKIIISGPIGSGKTSLAKILSKSLNYTLLEEKVDNDLLSKYYEDVELINENKIQHSPHVFLSEMICLQNHYEQLLSLSQDENAIFDTGPVDDYIFAKSEVNKHIMSSKEFSTYKFYYQQMFTLLESKLVSKDVLQIVITSKPKQILQNIQNRNRKYEVNDELKDYYVKIYNQYRKYFNNVKLDNLISVDDTKDFVHNLDYQKQIINQVKSIIEK